MVALARRAIQLSPRSSAAHTLLGDASFKMFRYDDAIAAYQRAIDLGDRSAEKGLERVRAAAGDP